VTGPKEIAMTTTRFFSRRPALLLAVLLLASRALLGQPQTEGYDPMRQITAQIMKANLHIVQDVTGSMERWPDSSNEPTGKANAFGYLAWAGPTKSCSNANCRYWYYDLTFEAPSRMAILKNALGNSVPLVTAYTPPTVSSPWTRAAPKPNTNSKKVWRFTYDYGRGKTGADPKPPFAPFETITIPGAYTSRFLTTAYTVSNFPKVVNGACTVGTCTYHPPQDLVGKNARRVNWGLTKYSTDGVATLVYIDTDGTNKHLDRLEAYLLPSGAYSPTRDDSNNRIQGLAAGGRTNTRAGLLEARRVLRDVTHPNDPMKDCDRPYGVILVTDGESNSGNGDDSGVAGCGSVTSNSWTSCPNNWRCYPAGAANDLYGALGRKPKVNTWVIGVSDEVGECELDFTAYAGRTDANSPREDAGFSGYAAPSPPPPAVATDPGNPYVAEDNPTTANFPLHYTPSHGHNAYFATTSSALADAITAIVNATATGDYTTSAPVSGLTAGSGYMVYLPSTEFPSWRGQFYAFDTRRQQFLDPPTNKVPNPDYELWNAADKLNARPSSERKIFTWKLASNGKSYDLVEVTTDSSNLATLQAIAGTTALTANVVDYIRGNDGTLQNKARSWKLGPVINSTPAIVASPEKWTQGNVPSHTDLERISREPLLFVGSNSGMMHAFRVVDGEEQIALLPPSLLAKQVDLYQNYVDSKKIRPSGQLPDPGQHLYGVANSLRFGDVRIGKDYRTIGLITLGPGGEEIAAIDITKIPRPDASPYNDPVTVLWSKTDAELAGLGTTWSIPAMAPTMKGTASNDDGKWRLLLGSGFDAASTAESQKDSNNYTPPRAFSLDVATGDLLQTKTLDTTTGATHANFVGNQAFADVVLFDPTAPSYKPDNIALMGVQADLNGRLWFLWTPSSSSLYNFSGDPVKGVDTTTLYGVNQSQPFYYNPAASGYGAYNKVSGGSQEKVGCAAYAFGSGSLYETSEAVTGPRVGETGYFIPRVYVATSEKPDVTTAHKLTASPTALTDNQIWQRPIAGSWCVKDCENADPTKRVYKSLGLATQLTAPPFLLAPKDETQSITALFLVYDPDEGCDGNSYVLQVDFKGTGATCSLRDNQGNFDVTQKAFNAGAGAASGFTIAGTQVLVAQSGIGEGQRAKLFVPEGLAASLAGGVEPRVRWWKELK